MSKKWNLSEEMWRKNKGLYLDSRAQRLYLFLRPSNSSNSCMDYMNFNVRILIIM